MFKLLHTCKMSTTQRRGCPIRTVPLSRDTNLHLCIAFGDELEVLRTYLLCARLPQPLLLRREPRTRVILKGFQFLWRQLPGTGAAVNAPEARLWTKRTLSQLHRDRVFCVVAPPLSHALAVRKSSCIKVQQLMTRDPCKYT